MDTSEVKIIITVTKTEYSHYRNNVKNNPGTLPWQIPIEQKMSVLGLNPTQVRIED